MPLLYSLIYCLQAKEISWENLYSEDGWNYSHKSTTELGDVEIFKKEIGDFPCFQGRAYTNSDPKVLLEIAADTESAIDWSSADLMEAKTLYRSETYMDYYQYLNVPLFSDRYWFLRGYFEEEGTETRFRWEKLNDDSHRQFHSSIQKKYPDSIETTINIGAWVFRQNPMNVEVRYYICTHPGGYVPTSLQSIGTEKTLPNNLYDLIKEGKRRSGS
jgi:hypothetical protein